MDDAHGICRTDLARCRRNARAGAPFRNPGVTAKMAAALDEVSAGRLILGIGCGWHEPEFEAFDLPFDHRVARFEEAAEVLIRLLRDGQADFDGRYHAARANELRPPPLPAARRS